VSFRDAGRWAPTIGERLINGRRDKVKMKRTVSQRLDERTICETSNCFSKSRSTCYSK